MTELIGGRARAESIRSIAVIANGAFSIANFRGPLIRAMIGRGVRVYALAPDYDPTTREAVLRLGAEPVDISLERTGMRPLRDLLDAARLVHVLRRLKPDATFAYFIKPVIYGSLAARLAGVRCRYALVAGVGYVFISEGRRETLKHSALRWLVLRLYRLGFAACRTVFFQNEEDISHFVGAGALPHEKAVRLNGTGVDLSYFAPAPSVVRPIRFLLIARLLREKGICEFVEAARIVRGHCGDCEFILLGGFDPSPGGFASEQIEEWKKEGIVQFMGHIDDVRPWIARSSIYVLPSYREGAPRSTQEAMAMARPVITTDAVGCRETVIEGVNGFMVPIRDAAALASAMMNFVNNPSLIGKMGAESRRLAERKFDIDHINETMLAVIGIDEPGANSGSSAPAYEDVETGT